MLTTIVLTTLIILGVILFKTVDEYSDWGIVPMLLCGLSIPALMIHLPLWAMRSYEYEVFESQFNAFEQTLHEARKNGNELEAATMMRDVAEWNQQLAKYQYKNSTTFFDQYIDDRIETLEPIK